MTLQQSRTDDLLLDLRKTSGDEKKAGNDSRGAAILNSGFEGKEHDFVQCDSALNRRPMAGIIHCSEGLDC